MELPLSSQLVPSLVFLESVDSTNLELERRLANDLPEFTTVMAAEQTAGLGRLGRSWVSEPASSISMSILLRPPSLESASQLTLLAANSVHRALTDLTGANLSIKWPNDILLEGKKVCGILASLSGPAVILGLGINLLSQRSAPDTATSLDQVASLSFDQVASAVLTNLREGYRELVSSQDFGLQLEYLRRNCSTLGQQVRAELPDGSEVRGTAVSISDSGHLVLKSDSIVELAAADVWHLRN